MNYYSVKLNGQAAQNEIIEWAKNNGADVIQASDGLYVAVNTPDWPDKAREQGFGRSVAITPLDSEESLRNEDAPPDLKALIKKHMH